MLAIRRALVLLLATLPVAAGCGDTDSALAPEDRAGSLSFGYTGERAGVFAASGELRLATDNSIQAGSWAAALRDDASGLTIAAFQPTAGSRGTLFLASLGNLTLPTTATLSCAAGQACSSGIAFNAVPAGSVSAADTTFVLVSGTVVVDTLTETRIAGRISALGRYTPSDGTVRDSTRTLAITDGRFSVPIRADLN